MALAAAGPAIKSDDNEQLSASLPPESLIMRIVHGARRHFTKVAYSLRFEYNELYILYTHLLDQPVVVGHCHLTAGRAAAPASTSHLDME